MNKTELHLPDRETAGKALLDCYRGPWQTQQRNRLCSAQRELFRFRMRKVAVMKTPRVRIDDCLQAFSTHMLLCFSARWTSHGKSQSQSVHSRKEVWLVGNTSVMTVLFIRFRRQNTLMYHSPRVFVISMVLVQEWNTSRTGWPTYTFVMWECNVVWNSTKSCVIRGDKCLA